MAPADRPASATMDVDGATLLGRTRLFGGLDGHDLEQLVRRATRRHYRRGEVVFHQGDAGDSLCIVVEGLVKVYVTSDDGDEMVLVTLREGDTFGELALIDGGRRSASAEAVAPATLLLLGRPALLETMLGHPGLADAMLRSLGSMIRRLTDQTADLVFLDLHGRVAKLLLTLAGTEDGPVQAAPVRLDLPLTQSELASMVGGSRQSVNQILRTFEALGYLEIDRRHLVLKRCDLLRRQARIHEDVSRI